MQQKLESLMVVSEQIAAIPYVDAMIVGVPLAIIVSVVFLKGKLFKSW